MITGYFGLPGSGKTTFLTMLAQKELKRIAKGNSKYERVYTNFFCNGCYMVRFCDLGRYDLRNALILLDELTLDADSRDFKQFSQDKKEFFLLHRHFNCDIVYFTQQWNGIDKKIRDCTSELFYVKKSFSTIPIFSFLSVFSVARKVYRTLEINEYTKEIVSGYRFPSLIEKLLSKTKQICFRPRWYNFFNSWEIPKKLPIYSDFVWAQSED